MENSVTPPRVACRGNGTTRYEREIAGTPKLADDPNERKWVGPWLLGETIGKGASGRVRLARHKRTRKLAAVKIVPKIHIGGGRVDPKAERVMQSIRREMVVMKLIHHPHIMDMYDVFEDQDELYLLLEYVEGGELFDYLVSRGRLDVAEALTYWRQIISGLDYCHRFNICHRDLKPENLLLDKENQIKIADFGMAALELNNGTSFLETSCGSPHYASPEVVSGKQYHGNASDIWSCGVVLFALLTGRLPFDDENMGELLRKVKSGKFDMPRSIPAGAKHLIARILVVDPAQRITMKEIIRHPFFTMNTPGVPPQIVNPSFQDAYRIIPSVDHIDRNILENITTLYRKIPQDEIIARLLSERRNWEKVFYFLLKDYHERQSEEYGHGMTFVDYTIGQGRAPTNTHRKTHSQSSHTGPTGTIKGRPADSSHTAGPTRHHHRQASLAPATPHTKGSPRSDRSSPVATRAAPPSPGDDSPRRQRAVVSGPRPNTALKENASASQTPTGIQPSEKQVIEEKAAPRRPDRNSTRPVSVGAAAALLATENTLAVESHPFPTPSPRARAYTVGAEKVPVTLATDAIASKIPETAPETTLPETTLNLKSDKSALRESKGADAKEINPNLVLPKIKTSIMDATPVSPVVGLGLQLPSPPLFATPTTPAPTAPPLESNDDKRKSSSLANHPATKPRPVSASLLTRSAMHPPQSPRANRARAETMGVVRDSSARGLIGKGKRPPSLRLDQVTKNMASYPSPPPSQASSLEPLLALQQSPIFTERFSLHLDAMMLKTPLSDPSPMELDDLEEDEDECNSMEVDASLRELGSEMSTSVGSPVTARLVEKRPRADTAATGNMTTGDWSFLTEADEARQAVPVQSLVVKQTVLAQPLASRRSSGDRGNPITNNTDPPRDRQPSGKKSLGQKIPQVGRKSTVVATLSPVLTPVEAIPTGWFAQLFHVKPAAYVFHSGKSFIETRTECSALLRSLGVSVEEMKKEGKYGQLRCHVDNIQEVTGKIVNKPVTFLARIAPRFTVRAPTHTRYEVSESGSDSSERRLPPPPQETCTVSLIQEHGAKSTLEVVASRLRQAWHLDSMMEPRTPRTPTNTRGFF